MIKYDSSFILYFTQMDCFLLMAKNMLYKEKLGNTFKI